MNANLKLQVVGLTNRAGILIGAADMVEQYAQLTTVLVQENEALEAQNAELRNGLGQVKAELDGLKNELADLKKNLPTAPTA